MIVASCRVQIRLGSSGVGAGAGAGAQTRSKRARVRERARDAPSPTSYGQRQRQLATAVPLNLHVPLEVCQNLSLEPGKAQTPQCFQLSGRCHGPQRARQWLLVELFAHRPWRQAPRSQRQHLHSIAQDYSIVSHAAQFYQSVRCDGCEASLGRGCRCGGQDQYGRIRHGLAFDTFALRPRENAAGPGRGRGRRRKRRRQFGWKRLSLLAGAS
jgi:hypothetical protein